MNTSPPPRLDLSTVASSFLILAISISLMVVGQDVFIPLVLGIFIAYLMIALAHAIGRLRLDGRQLPGWVCLTASIVASLLVLTGLAQLIAGNIGAAMDAAPQYQARFEELLAHVNGVLESVFNRREPLTLAAVMEQVDLGAMVTRFAAALQSIVGSAFEILIYVIFVLFEHRTFDRKLRAIFPNPTRLTAVRATLAQIGQRTETYVLIKTLVSLMVGGVTYVTLLAMGVDFAAFLGLLVFLLNFIPYIGSVIGVVLPALLALLQFGSLGLFAAIAGILAATHAVVGNVVEPRLMGRSLNLSPLLMVVALTVWGSIWGITGMLLSVPLMVIAMIILGQFPRTRPIALLMSENGELT